MHTLMQFKTLPFPKKKKKPIVEKMLLLKKIYFLPC